jgi:hypothetical protein
MYYGDFTMYIGVNEFARLSMHISTSDIQECWFEEISSQSTQLFD